MIICRDWLHMTEGLRIIACKAGTRCACITGPATICARVFPLIVEALARLRFLRRRRGVRLRDDGMLSFALLWHCRRDGRVFLYARST